MGMAMEGVDIAVLYPTNGLSLLGRNDMDPELSLAICQAYNNWIHEFCRYSPEQLKFVAMLPMHDVQPGLPRAGARACASWAPSARSSGRTWSTATTGTRTTGIRSTRSTRS